MDIKQGKFRVSADHWKAILDFAEIYPEIITNKFSNDLNGKKTNRNIWDQLTNKLNSLGLGSRTVEEWKKTLADWKSKTKTKAAKISNYIQETGGGPANPIVPNSLEERLLSLMGKTSTYGDNTVEEKGLKRKTNDYAQGGAYKKNEIKGKENVSENRPALIEQNIIVEDICDHEYFYDLDNENVHIFNNTKEVEEQSEDTLEMTTENISSEKRKKDGGRILKTKIDAKSMHNDILNVLCNIDSNIGSISKSFEKLVNHFCRVKPVIDEDL